MKYPKLESGMIGEFQNGICFVVVGNSLMTECGEFIDISKLDDRLRFGMNKVTFLTNEACDFSQYKNFKSKFKNLIPIEESLKDWNRRCPHKYYYSINRGSFINGCVNILDTLDIKITEDNNFYKNFDYFPCNDFTKSDIKELNRLQIMQRALWKFAKYNKALQPKIDYYGINAMGWCVYPEKSPENPQKYYACATRVTPDQVVFTTKEWAEQAIKEVVEPLMKKWVEEDALDD